MTADERTIKSAKVDHVDPYRAYLASPNPEDAQATPLSMEHLDDVFPSHHMAVEEELRRFFAGFRAKIFFGHRHPAASPAWREESVLEGPFSPPRFAIRLHVFERTMAGEAGRYLGFATLRPPESLRTPAATAEAAGALPGFTYILEAELAAPRHMLRPRYHLILTTASSPRLGVLPFRSAAYVAPHPEDSRGSTCIHVAVSQALHLTMGRFGSRPVNQREFDALLWKKFSAQRTLEDISTKGARLQEVLSVIEKCNAGGFIESFTAALHKGSLILAAREAHRCITDLLANGMAVIVAVDYARLSQGGQLSPGEPHLHGALIFGMHLLHSPYEVNLDDLQSDTREGFAELPGRSVGNDHLHSDTREDFAELPGRFVGHDISAGPFVEWRVSELLQAASAVYGKESEEHGIHLLAIGPKGITLGLHRVRSLAISLMLAEASDPQSAFPAACRSATPLEPEGWRYVTRLIHLNEVVGRYFADHGLTLPAVFGEAFGKQDAESNSTDYCWSVEVRLPKPGNYRSGTEIFPSIVYLWSIAGPDEPRAIVRWIAPGKIQVETAQRKREFAARL